MNCLMRGWDSHEAELRAGLRRRLNNTHDAEDLLQNLFIKALRQDEKFCEISNARAWLFEVARNALADRLRMKREQIELPEDLAAEHDEPAAVETLAGCLPRVLAKLLEEDREALTRCDLEGMSQQGYARLKHLSLPGHTRHLSRTDNASERTRGAQRCRAQERPVLGILQWPEAAATSRRAGCGRA